MKQHTNEILPIFGIGGMPNRRSLFRSWLLLEGAISIFSLACEIEFFQHTESVIMQSRDGARQCKFR